MRLVRNETLNRNFQLYSKPMVNQIEPVQVLNWYHLIYPSVSKFEIDEKTPEYIGLSQPDDVIQIKSARSWLWTIWGCQFVMFIAIPLCFTKMVLSILKCCHAMRKYKTYKALKT